MRLVKINMSAVAFPSQLTEDISTFNHLTEISVTTEKLNHIIEHDDARAHKAASSNHAIRLV